MYQQLKPSRISRQELHEKSRTNQNKVDSIPHHFIAKVHAHMLLYVCLFFLNFLFEDEIILVNQLSAKSNSA